MSRDWFFRNWMNAGFVTGLFLLAIAPLLAGIWDLPFLLVYLLLPAYMVHQLEEHYDDRFRTFVNAHLAGGRDALTTEAVVVINVPLVWGVDLAAIYLARFIDLGLGLIAVYLTLVNAVVHVVGGVVLRSYDPGLVTAIILFLPLGVWALVAIAEQPGVTPVEHIGALVLAILVHIAIVVHVLRRARLLAVR
jgi:hypothetical protein